MDDLKKENNELVFQKSEDDEALYGKVLNIRASTPNIDLRGILNKICQLVDMTDVLNKVKKRCRVRCSNSY